MWLTTQSKSPDDRLRIDEFALLMLIVRLERFNFLREIQYKQLFSIV